MREQVLRIQEETSASSPDWPDHYTNADTGKVFAPHNDEEGLFVFNDTPRYALLKGGEGSGKTSAGCVKALNRVRRGMSGIAVSPDLPHFKRSLWPEFRRWCPWEMVVEKYRYKGKFTWEPHQPFILPFTNGAVIYMGGIDEPGSWEGPNVSWAWFDEARRKKTPNALKVLDGRIRIAGLENEPPQIFITSTPRKHWMFQFFGPVVDDDPHEAFKDQALVVTLHTRDNIANLSEGFVEQRRLSLTEAEARVLLEAEWEDIEDTERFLPSMSMWDLCEEVLPKYSHTEAMVLALDAAIGGSSKASSFGIVGVTRHPSRHEDVAVRYVQKWDAPTGGKIDFGAEGGPEWTIRNICKTMNVVQVCFDPYQLHDMATRLNKENVAWLKEFSQGAKRLEADRQLLDLVIQRRIAHKGQADLRQHIANANRKLADDGRRLRIVKREAGLNNDLAVCLSMSAYEILRLNV